jgi:hypothetical protein
MGDPVTPPEPAPTPASDRARLAEIEQFVAFEMARGGTVAMIESRELAGILAALRAAEAGREAGDLDAATSKAWGDHMMRESDDATALPRDMLERDWFAYIFRLGWEAALGVGAAAAGEAGDG